MIYLSLFWEFLKIGMFSFGGAYGAIPMIREAVISKGWLDEDMFTNIIAVSESTPGPIMVNTATYIGNIQAGFLGALVSTIGVVLPSFLIILLIASLLKNALKNRYVQAALNGIKPCLAGVILATGIYMIFSIAFNDINSFVFDLTAMIIFAVLIAAVILWTKFQKKELSPIALIVFSAVLGVFLY